MLETEIYIKGDIIPTPRKAQGIAVVNLASSWFHMVANEDSSGLCKTFIHSTDKLFTDNSTDNFSLIGYENSTDNFSLIGYEMQKEKHLDLLHSQCSRWECVVPLPIQDGVRYQTAGWWIILCRFASKYAETFPESQLSHTFF